MFDTVGVDANKLTHQLKNINRKPCQIRNVCGIHIVRRIHIVREFHNVFEIT